jgi:hypothetical protein
MSQRHRHGYAADLPHGLPDGSMETAQGVPATSAYGKDAPHPAHIRQVRAGVKMKDVTTPVPRVLLFATLAGPAPSGSTDTSRLCQGCSHPPRRHPDQAALSSIHLLRQANGGGLSPPLEPTAPHGANRNLDRPSDCQHSFGSSAANRM